MPLRIPSLSLLARDLVTRRTRHGVALSALLIFPAAAEASVEEPPASVGAVGCPSTEPAALRLGGGFDAEYGVFANAVEAVGAAQPLSAPAGVSWVRPPAVEGSQDEKTRLDRDARPEAPAGTALFPTYRWPLERVLRDGSMIVNYFDHDPSAGVLDYSGGTHAYDTHAGTDILLFDFRLMDRGFRVVAAAAGNVTAVSTPTPYDRSCDFNWPDDGNWVEVANGDGSYTDYLHLRARSTAVKVGDPVSPGQLIGLIGSSGYSTGPHLHFEPWDGTSGYVPRDPFSGSSNPLPSLWQAQGDYVGDDPLWFSGVNVYSEADVGGSIFNTTYCDLVRGLLAPVVYGANEPRLCIWTEFQGRVGDPGRVEVRKPNGTLWAFYDFTLQDPAHFGWFWLYWFWDGNVAPADYGTWKVQAYSGAQLSRESSFQVGPTTVFGAHIAPRAGRSFHINGAVQRDTLRRHPATPSLTYSLIDAPPFVTLVDDSVVTVGGVSNQATRSLFFRAVGVDAAARRDTAWYHVVDFTKPIESLVGVTPTPNRRIELAVASANPSSGPTALRFAIPEAGHVRLDVTDITGRRAASLFDGWSAAGEQTIAWNGTDGSGRRCPAGLYFARVRWGGETRSVRVVLTP